MAISRNVYSIYGVRVQDDADWVALDDDPGQCRNNGEVGYFRAGAYDRNMVFLALNWRRVDPGEYIFHPGERPAATESDRNLWNKKLRATADRLGLRVVDGPGWFTIPDEK